jgi:hypothetical protein
MAGPEFARPHPYLDACPRCPDTPRIPPVLVSPAAPGRVVADYARPVCGHTWSQVWARDVHDGEVAP